MATTTKLAGLIALLLTLPGYAHDSAQEQKLNLKTLNIETSSTDRSSITDSAVTDLEGQASHGDRLAQAELAHYFFHTERSYPKAYVWAEVALTNGIAEVQLSLIHI